MSEEYPDEIKELKADNRGRVNLGTDYKNSTVRVAILEVEEDNSTGETDE